MYNIRWDVGRGILDPVGNLIDYELTLTTPPARANPLPLLDHEDTTLDYGATTRRKVPELEGSDFWELWFDGGASRGLGTGGFAVYDPDKELAVAQAVWYGDLKPTVNSSEMGALLSGLEWVRTTQNVKKLMVCGDSKLTIDFFNRVARPSNT